MTVRTSANQHPPGQRPVAARQAVAAVVAVLMLCAGVLLSLDSVRIHARCPEHGESIHLGERAQAQTARAHDAIHASSTDPEGDHCTGWDVSKSQKVTRACLAGTPALLPAQGPVGGSQGTETPSPLFVAPKNSPPTLALL